MGEEEGAKTCEITRPDKTSMRLLRHKLKAIKITHTALRWQGLGFGYSAAVCTGRTLSQVVVNLYGGVSYTMAPSLHSPPLVL